MVNHILRVHILFMVPHKIVKLVWLQWAVCSSPQQVDELCGIFVFLSLCSVLPRAMLYCVSQKDIQKKVQDYHASLECAHDPVEDSHVDLHELSFDEAWIFIHSCSQ